GFISIATAGTIQFRSESDDGSVVYIDGNLVVNNNFFQGAPGNAPNGAVALTTGLHTIEVGFYQGGGGASEILKWDPANTSTYVVIPSTVLFSQTNNLTKTGAGTLTLSGTNTYVGATSIQQGTVTASVNQALGAVASG